MEKLIISNLPEDMDEDELTEMFRDYHLKAVKLEIGKYAVLAFEDFWDASKAMKAWDKQFSRGHRLNIKPAKW